MMNGFDISSWSFQQLERCELQRSTVEAIERDGTPWKEMLPINCASV